MERKLQGDTGFTRSLSSRDDGFGRKGVSFVDVVGTFIEPARPPPRIWRLEGGYTMRLARHLALVRRETMVMACM